MPTELNLEQTTFHGLSFADNPEPRCACVLVLDNSGSMAGDKITQLNEGVRVFKEELVGDALASKRVEVAMVSFGPIQTRHDFASPADFYPPALTPEGATPMGEATLRAIQMVEDRKAIYRANGISSYRPWIILITDGAPTDSITAAGAAVREGEAKKKFAFFAIGVDSADMGELSKLSARPARLLRGTSFKEFFLWLSSSMKSVSQSSPTADTVALPSPDGWTSL